MLKSIMFENRASHSSPSPSPVPQKGEAAHFNARAVKIPTGANAGLERILAERTDLIGQGVEQPRSGLSALTFLFPHEVVKMPRQADQFEDFSREHRVLAHMHAAGLPVPAVTFVSGDGTFYAQQRLGGAQFDCGTLDDAQKFEQAAQTIAAFMVGAQNAVSAQDATSLDLKQTTPDAAELKALLDLPEYQRLIREADEDVAGALRDYVATRAGATPVFAHADIQPANLLCDTAGNINTVVDFGLCHYGDAAVAFHAIYRYFPHKFAERVADIYAEATGTEPVTLQQAVTARLAHELVACAKAPQAGQELCNAHRNWLREIIIEYDNAVSGYVAPQNIFRIII